MNGCKPHAAALTMGFGCKVRFENLIQDISGHSAAIVGHDESKTVVLVGTAGAIRKFSAGDASGAFAAFQDQVNSSARIRHDMACVGEQIYNDSFQFIVSR